jgi:glycosyl transferase family 25
VAATKNLSNLQVDGVLCISLRNRQDRRNLIKNEFAQSGLVIEFILVDADVENPERGCFNSHIKCATLAVERRYKAVLILEDDATLSSFSPSQILRINRFMTTRTPKLLYLGATLGKLWLTWNRGIARVRAKGTFAYILSNEGCRELIKLSPYTGTPIDKLFTKSFKAYCSLPLICNHQPECLAKSDISTCRIADGSSADEKFWQRNWRRQYTQVLKNIGKTIVRRDI